MEMKTLGWRFFFDQDGEIIYSDGEIMGSHVTPRKKITSVGIVDFDYGELDLSKHDIIGIDVETRKPVLVARPPIETAEQRIIRELEDALLMQAENEIGGIL